MTTTPTPHPQILTEWGAHGIAALKPHAAVLIIVDVLSFCTAVDIATTRGATIIPFPHGDAAQAQAAATRQGALCASRRNQPGRFSLSPQSLLTIEPGTRLLLPSPNGATLTLQCGDTPTFAGCLRNATAIAQAARAVAGNGTIAIMPAGERWPDGSLRFAIEDWLGAGAIIDALNLPASPESHLARASFRAVAHNLEQTLTHSISGQELLSRGHAPDITLAAQHDISHSAPRWTAGHYSAESI